MFLEVVKFGNGKAIEVRDRYTKVSVLFMITCALDHIIPVPNDPFAMDTVYDECYSVIDGIIDPKHRWLMYCTNVNIINQVDSPNFQMVYRLAFGQDAAAASPVQIDDMLQAQVMAEFDIQARECVWLVDRGTCRIFCVHFQFAAPIYKGTLFAGVMLKHKTYESQYKSTGGTQPNDPILAQDILHQLHEMMPLPHDDGAPITESLEISITEYIIQQAYLWCGNTCKPGAWIAQQVNVWFKTPMDETCWFRPDPAKDPFVFVVGLWDEMIAPSCSTARWIPLEAMTAQNTSLRYPNGNVTCQLGDGRHLGIGHFLPQLRRWTAQQQDVRIFRLYKTQYPYVYSLMPNDTQKVKKLKTTLKQSTETNPTVTGDTLYGEQQPRQPSLGCQGSAKVTPLIANVPTLELDRYINDVFHETPHHHYRLWWCVRYNTSGASGGASCWIPVSPV